ncbi:MAG: response regulator [Leptolyngbyaceae bacterium]|nr:response regulator [Leptolyngbyaceae bacterium]
MPTGTRPKILIVDDSAENLLVLMEILQTDYAVITAKNGEKALQLAAKEPVPDLIVLDVVMPDMDGYEVCKQLKQNPLTQNIPVIFGTALNEAGNEAQGFELGAVDYITKPFRGPVVKARLKSHLAMQRLNQELKQTNQALAEATRLKDEFLANMSHELRTPLNVILGTMEALQEEILGPINERQLKAVLMTETSASHLLRLINDILDIAKIGSGEITLEYGSVNVKQLCSSSLTFVKQQACKKSIQLVSEIPPNLSDLSVDEVRMRQVLINLLTNAVKFTPEGGKVTLAVSGLSATEKTPASLRFAVTDTGIGIAPENIPKLFKPFVQIDSALNRQQTGTGLGLALVKQIVELHGGQVGLTSELGAGSCFTVDLPYETTMSSAPQSLLGTTTASTQPRQSRAMSAPLVLLAEDESANVETFSTYLEAKRYRLLLARNGQEAITLACSEHPDIILMDIQMPGMDGLEAIQQIRQQETLRQVPIIAVTALTMDGDRERCLEAGANEYMAKPVKLKQLDTLIQTLVNSANITPC